MKKRETGLYQPVVVRGEGTSAFVPHPLPPTAPPLVIEARLGDRLQQAQQALDRLNLAGEMVPSLSWFIYAFVRKEAVLSSQIEGTQASLFDLLRFEAEEDLPPDPDVEEVANYLSALEYARKEIGEAQGLPLSMRLLHNTHQLLMRGVRGADKQPGEVRRGQNWIGGGRAGAPAFVPPPHHVLPKLLSDFEKYMHDGNELPPLVRTGLLHAQFETIHPYLDGNGRIGRLLITLLLEHWRLLDKPLLYLSLFFRQNQNEYYNRLNAVRTDGDWEGWIDFFLDGVATIAEEAIALSRRLFSLVSENRDRLLQGSTQSLQAVRLFERLPRHPIVSVATASRLMEVTTPTAIRAIGILEEAGILVETTGKKRNRSFAYRIYLGELRADTELETP